MFEIYVSKSEEVLRVSSDGEFIWHPDADRLIEEGNFNDFPSMKYILRALRKKPMTEEEIKGKGKFSDRALPWITAGVRFAEKHHGIDGNPSGSIKSQEVDKSRKPMTEEEIEELCNRREFDQLQGGMSEAFYLGVRFAEKHHGISGEDQ